MVWWGSRENTKSGNMRKTTKLIGLFVLQFILTVEKISSEDSNNCSLNVCVCKKGIIHVCWSKKNCKCKRENALRLMFLQQRNVFVFNSTDDRIICQFLNINLCVFLYQINRVIFRISGAGSWLSIWQFYCGHPTRPDHRCGPHSVLQLQQSKSCNWAPLLPLWKSN